MIKFDEKYNDQNNDLKALNQKLFNFRIFIMQHNNTQHQIFFESYINSIFVGI